MRLTSKWELDASTVEEAREKYPGWRTSKAKLYERDGKVFGEAEHSYEGWVIEISSLDDLLKLVEREGDIIVSEDTNVEVEWGLEIYDDYRE